MKNQYLCDVNDYIKYGLLRRLSDPSRFPVGVFWMLTPDDGGRDGQKLGYLERPGTWRGHDPELFDQLKACVRQEERTIADIREQDILPGAVFFEETIPDAEVPRRAVMERGFTALRECPLLFFDQDNGLEVKSVPKGRKRSSKYLYLDEVARAWGQGHSLLLYQHFPREERESYCRRRVRELSSATGAMSMYVLGASNTCFFLLVKESHAPDMAARLMELERRWGGRVTTRYMDPLLLS